MDVDVGVTKEKRVFALKAIPWFGWIAELANIKGPVVSYPSINPQEHMMFIAEWYKPSEQAKN